MFLQNLASMLLLDCAHTLHFALFYLWKNYPEFVNIQTCSAGQGSSVFSQCAGNRSLYCSCRITLHNIWGILTLLLCTAWLVGSTFWNQEELYTLWKTVLFYNTFGGIKRGIIWFLSPFHDFYSITVLSFSLLFFILFQTFINPFPSHI